MCVQDAPQDTSASHLAEDMVAGTSQPTPPGIAGIGEKNEKFGHVCVFFQSCK